MSAQILQMRDYKTKEEREAEIHRLGLAIMSEALRTDTDDDRPDYTAPEKDPA